MIPHWSRSVLSRGWSRGLKERMLLIGKFDFLFLQSCMYPADERASTNSIIGLGLCACTKGKDVIRASW
jgi:hypothetical protein